MSIPTYWKTSLAAIDETMAIVRKGQVMQICHSAGGRPVCMAFYGKPNDIKRTANLSSALGAGSTKYYADRTAADYRPTLMLVGCIHGGEFEGTAALNNLIYVLETGRDIAGCKHPKLTEIAKKINLLLIPCANPDGRARINFDSFVGRTFYDLRYYNQGTWKDGSLCDWPGCKAVHPIAGHVDFLGGYFNDDGINLMHDNFFMPMAAETKALFETADKYAPDLCIQLHGCGDVANMVLPTANVPDWMHDVTTQLDARIASRCKPERLKYYRATPGYKRRKRAAFNLASAISHLCGKPCIVYESNQGLVDGKIVQDYEQIYRHHIILFEELFDMLEAKV